MKIKTIVNVIIGLIKLNNKYLLTYRENDNEDTWANKHWQLPGGSINFGESTEQTLIREIKEELGITISKFKLIPKIITVIRKDWQGIFISYLCYFEGKQKIILNTEASQYGWFTEQEIKKLKRLKGCDEIIEASKLI